MSQSKERLPDTRKHTTRSVFDMLIIGGLEAVTRSLLRGDAHDMELLRPLAWRCRALANAFDERLKQAQHMGELEGEQLTTDHDRITNGTQP